MSFGFPAFHSEEVVVVAGNSDIRGLCHWVLASLGWKISEEFNTGIRVQTTVSLTSWSEVIEIDFLAPDRLRIKSACALPTQCFDWGKNRKNVRRFKEEVERMQNKLSMPPVN